MYTPVQKHRVMFLVIILMVAISAFGRIRPNPIDVDAILDSYTKLAYGKVSGNHIRDWSKEESAYILIAIGTGCLNTLTGSIITDSIHYEAYMEALKMVEKGVATLDSIDKLHKESPHNILYAYVDSMVIPVHFTLGNAYDKVFNFTKANDAYIQTASEVGRDYGTDSEEFVFWTNQCAESIQRKNKNYQKAIEILLPALDAALNSPYVKPTTACEFLISLSQKYQRNGRDDDAKRLAIEAEKKMGDDHTCIFRVSKMLGEIYWKEGDYENGSVHIKKAADNAPSLSDFFAAGVDFANLMRKTGFHKDAENQLLTLEKYVDRNELTSEDLFNYYESLGVLYTFSNPEKSQDYFTKAEKYINVVDYTVLIRHILNSQVFPNEGNSFKIISALDRAEWVFSDLVGNDYRLALELALLKGYYLLEVHDYKEAQKYLETVELGMTEIAEGDPFRLDVLNELIRLQEIIGNDVRREYLTNQLLLESKHHGETSSVYANAIASALHFCLQKNLPDRAEHFLRKYENLRPGDFDTQCYNYRFHLLRGKYTDAELVLGKIKETFPERQSEIDLMFQRLYSLTKSSRIYDYADDVFQDFKERTLRQMIYMSNDERRNMNSEIKSRRDEVLSALSFAPDIVEVALDYSLFSKGLFFHTQSVTDKQLGLSDSARIELGTLRDLKIQLNRAISAGEDELAQRLLGSIKSRERYLWNDFLNFDDFQAVFEDYSTESIKNKIKDKDIYLEFVDINNEDTSHIGVFIISKNLPVRFLDLGESARLAQSNANSRLWKPILNTVTSDAKIYFSSDGALNIFPIEFAEDEAGVPICDKYDLHRVFHLSDIRPETGIGNRVEAIGVADHNSPSGQALGLNDGYRGNWDDLAGVETELYRIAENLDGTTQYHRAFNDEATEAYVKNLSGQPITTLHVSTHGFYRGEKELTEALSDSSNFDHNMASRLLLGNRSSVSGLVMRNGNLSWKAKYVTEDEDNILTSEEVETLSFPNLNLTVLSACETGLGETSADGVWGLRRAFRIAGSGSMICSLCKVNDSATADFMAEFYHRAAEGSTIHDAFYGARAELLDRDPSKKKEWSSFILIE